YGFHLVGEIPARHGKGEGRRTSGAGHPGNVVDGQLVGGRGRNDRHGRREGGRVHAGPGYGGGDGPANWRGLGEILPEGHVAGAGGGEGRRAEEHSVLTAGRAGEELDVVGGVRQAVERPLDVGAAVEGGHRVHHVAGGRNDLRPEVVFDEIARNQI